MNAEANRSHGRTPTYSKHGRSYCYITCPFCGQTVKVYVWSLSGSGKKCPCGAKHLSGGITKAPQEKAP